MASKKMKRRKKKAMDFTLKECIQYDIFINQNFPKTTEFAWLGNAHAMNIKYNK